MVEGLSNKVASERFRVLTQDSLFSYEKERSQLATLQKISIAFTVLASFGVMAPFIAANFIHVPKWAKFGVGLGGAATLGITGSILRAKSEAPKSKIRQKQLLDEARELSKPRPKRRYLHLSDGRQYGSHDPKELLTPRPLIDETLPSVLEQERREELEEHTPLSHTRLVLDIYGVDAPTAASYLVDQEGELKRLSTLRHSHLHQFLKAPPPPTMEEFREWKDEKRIREAAQVVTRLAENRVALDRFLQMEAVFDVIKRGRPIFDAPNFNNESACVDYCRHISVYLFVLEDLQLAMAGKELPADNERQKVLDKVIEQIKKAPPEQRKNTLEQLEASLHNRFKAYRKAHVEIYVYVRSLLVEMGELTELLGGRTPIFKKCFETTLLPTRQHLASQDPEHYLAGTTRDLAHHFYAFDSFTRIGKNATKQLCQTRLAKVFESKHAFALRAHLYSLLELESQYLPHSHEIPDNPLLLTETLLAEAEKTLVKLKEKQTKYHFLKKSIGKGAVLLQTQSFQKLEQWLQKAHARLEKIHAFETLERELNLLARSDNPLGLKTYYKKEKAWQKILHKMEEQPILMEGIQRKTFAQLVQARRNALESLKRRIPSYEHFDSLKVAIESAKTKAIASYEELKDFDQTSSSLYQTVDRIEKLQTLGHKVAQAKSQAKALLEKLLVLDKSKKLTALCKTLKEYGTSPKLEIEAIGFDKERTIEVLYGEQNKLHHEIYPALKEAKRLLTNAEEMKKEARKLDPELLQKRYLREVADCEKHIKTHLVNEIRQTMTYDQAMHVIQLLRAKVDQWDERQNEIAKELIPFKEKKFDFTVLNDRLKKEENNLRYLQLDFCDQWMHTIELFTVEELESFLPQGHFAPFLEKMRAALELSDVYPLRSLQEFIAHLYAHPTEKERAFKTLETSVFVPTIKAFTPEKRTLKQPRGLTLMQGDCVLENKNYRPTSGQAQLKLMRRKLHQRALRSSQKLEKEEIIVQLAMALLTAALGFAAWKVKHRVIKIAVEIAFPFSLTALSLYPLRKRSKEHTLKRERLHQMYTERGKLACHASPFKQELDVATQELLDLRQAQLEKEFSKRKKGWNRPRPSKESLPPAVVAYRLARAVSKVTPQVILDYAKRQDADKRVCCALINDYLPQEKRRAVIEGCELRIEIEKYKLRTKENVEILRATMP